MRRTPVSDLSGGQHTRLLLGRAVLAQPNFLLLDEPSNHLDLPSLLWLEDFLRRWQVASSWYRTTRDFWTVSATRAGFCATSACTVRYAVQPWSRWPRPTQRHARHAGEQNEIDRLAASSKRLAIWGREHDNEIGAPSQVHAKACRKAQEDQTFVSRGSPWRLKLQGRPLAADRLMAFEGLHVRAGRRADPV